MNRRLIQAPAVAASAALIGGVAVVVLPQHALTIVQLVLVTLAVAAAMGVVGLVFGDGVGAGRPRQHDRWARLTSPFRRVRLPDETRSEPPEIERARNYLGGQRLLVAAPSASVGGGQSSAGLPPMPPEVVRRLSRILRSSLYHQGVDPGVAAQQASLSQLSLAVLSVDLELGERDKQNPRDKRARRRYLAPDSHQVSQVVHAVLDDVDRLLNGGAPVHGPTGAVPGPPGAPFAQPRQTSSPRGSR
jgi:hypothetical protein